MQVSCLQENLTRGLSLVGRVIPKAKSPIPMIQNVLLCAENGQLQVVGTDLATVVTVTLDSQVYKEGKLLLPYKHLAELVSSLPRGRVDLEETTKGVDIRCGKVKARLGTLTVSDFPPIPDSGGDTSVIMSSSEVRSGLGVAFAAAASKGRPVLNTIRLEVTPGKVTWVAADGFRLAVQEIPIQTEITKTALIPSDLATLISQISEESVVVGFSNGRISFQTANVVITSALIIGEYPQYRRVIPQNRPHLEVSQQSFVSVLGSAMSLVGSDGEVVIEAEKGMPGSLKISSRSPEIGELESTMDASVPEPIKIVLNGSHLLDALKSMNEGSVLMEFSSKSDPLVLRQENLLVVLMPFVGGR